MSIAQDFLHERRIQKKALDSKLAKLALLLAHEDSEVVEELMGEDQRRRKNVTRDIAGCLLAVEWITAFQGKTEELEKVKDGCLQDNWKLIGLHEQLSQQLWALDWAEWKLRGVKERSGKRLSRLSRLMRAETLYDEEMSKSRKEVNEELAKLEALQQRTDQTKDLIGALSKRMRHCSRVDSNLEAALQSFKSKWANTT
mmetsp:Transcript_85261/g.198226  ORF Transcript_85261/g.198226 Transcript_85261/m.198226 type:complete len:199 (-) Transcript_85261:40-636(-)